MLLRWSLGTAFPGQAMQGQRGFVERLRCGQQLLKIEEGADGLILFAFLDGIISLITESTDVLENAGERGDDAVDGYAVLAVLTGLIGGCERFGENS